MRKFTHLLFLLLPVILSAQGKVAPPKTYPCKMDDNVVEQKKGAPGIRMHCNRGSLKGAEPLFIVDGEIATSEELKHLATASISSIDILKNETTVAVYGRKAINGVVIIKTKNREISIKDALTGDVLPGASVKINSKNGVANMAANSNGIVSVPAKQFSTIRNIEVTYVGYEPIVKDYAFIDKSEDIVMAMTPKSQLLDKIIVTGFPAIRCGFRGCWQHCIDKEAANIQKQEKEKKSSTGSTNFLAYPNPASRGNTIHITIPDENIIYYKIFSSNSALIQTQAINNKAAKKIAITTDKLLSGAYIVQFFSERGTKLTISKFIIQ